MPNNPYPATTPDVYTGIDDIDDAVGGPGTSTGDLVRALLESTGHRTNLMSQNIEAFGAGLSCDDAGWMHLAVAFAGTFAQASGPENPTSPVPVTAAGSGYSCPTTQATTPAPKRSSLPATQPEASRTSQHKPARHRLAARQPGRNRDYTLLRLSSVTGPAHHQRIRPTVVIVTRGTAPEWPCCTPRAEHSRCGWSPAPTASLR